MEILSSRMLIRTADYERSLAFYRDGLGLAIWREYGSGTIFFAGQSLIELAGHGRDDDDDDGQFPGAIWLQVRDVYDAQRELSERGVQIAREPRQEPWGLHEMHVVDPDGVMLIVVQVPPEHPLRDGNRR
jgi:catechol 2,3-dioxygenase-like lactoylglutathione lyase family enzyme